LHRTKDLDKAFGKNDQKEICMEILASGEVQLSEKERTSAQAALLKEICTIVSDKCVNPQSKRPVTVGVVERALSEMHFNANISKPAKKQVRRRSAVGCSIQEGGSARSKKCIQKGRKTLIVGPLEAKQLSQSAYCSTSPTTNLKPRPQKTKILSPQHRNQALEAIKLLEGKYPIERAPMRIKMSLPLSRKAELESAVDEVSE